MDNELAGTNLSSRLTAVYALDDRNSVKFIAGQSFRAPTLFEQFFSRYGNPDVKPEKATSVEVAYLRAAKGVYLQALAYQGSNSDKIVRARTSPLIPTDTTIKYVNSSEFMATGLELEVKYLNPTFVDAYLGLDTLLKTDSGDQILLPAPTDHYDIKYVPRTHLKGGLSRTMGGLTLSMTALYMSSARGSQPGSVEIGGQTTCAPSASYLHPVGRVLLRHALSVKNAGDRLTQFANYAIMDQPRLQAVPLEDMGRQVSYALRFSF